MRFVSLIRFTGQGVKEVRQSVSRARAFRERAEAAGIVIHQQLWTQGSCDGVLVFDAPSPEDAAAVMLQLASHGYVQTETMAAYDASGMESVVSRMK